MTLHLYRSTAWADFDYGLTERDDGWRWRIRATNGRIIADSAEAYGRLRDAAHGAGLVTSIDLSGVKAGRAYGSDWQMGNGKHVRWHIEVDA